MNIKDAQVELAKRELARRDFLHYIKYVFPKFQDIAYQGNPEDKVHHRITEALMRVARGECKRLMIFCPPRLGKSTNGTQYLPSWFLGLNPHLNVIVSSYSSELANDFGRKTKRICESQLFKNVFPNFEFAKDKREWGNRETSKGGGYYSVGVWGSITGKGANILIIDDPVKDREQANSATIQAKVIDWYDSVALTRLQDQDSAIILIMTRWNPNDLGGYLEREEKHWGDKREKVIIQAIDDNGNEIIRPWKRDEGHFSAMKSKMLKENRYALYQQDPINAQNGIFRREMFQYFKLSDFERADGILKKSDLTCGIVIDPAFSSSKKSDDATVCLYGKHKITKNLYQLDTYADTSAPSATFSAIISMINRARATGYKVSFIHCESAKINREQTKFIQDLKKELIFYDIKIPFYTTEARGKKEDRIKQECEPPMTAGGFFMRGDGNTEFMLKMEEQFLQFPNGKHDDIIDNIAQAYMYFGKMERKLAEKNENTADRYAGVCNVNRDSELY